MATASTLPAVKSALVTLFDAATTADVSYAWAGPNTSERAVWLGRMQTGDLLPSTRIESDLPTIQAGRKQRQESYTVEFTIWVARPDLTPDGAATAEADAFTILAALDGVLANDPKLGLTSIQWARLGDVEIVGGGPVPFEKGWAMQMLGSILVEARLT